MLCLLLVDGVEEAIDVEAVVSCLVVAAKHMLIRCAIDELIAVYLLLAV